MMGILDWFRKKEEAVSVSLSDLSSYLASYLEPLQKRYDDQLSLKYRKLDSSSQELRVLLTKLERAELRNPSVPAKEKQFMKGNRENYLRAARQLLAEQLTTEKLDQFGKSTARSYQILQEFFADETQATVAKLKSISSTLKEIDDLKKHDPMKQLAYLREKINTCNAGIKRKKELSSLLAETHDTQKQLLSQRTEVRQKIKDLNSSQKHKAYSQLKEAFTSAQHRLKTIQYDVRSLFSSLKKPLRKYERISDYSNLIQSYLDDPAKAILKDKAFQIIRVLSDLKALLPTLDLIPKKAEKASSMIVRITRALLEEKKKELLEASRSLEQAQSAAEKNPFLEAQQALHKSLDSIESRITREKKKAAEYEKELQQLDLSKALADIQENASILVTKKLNIHINI